MFRWNWKSDTIFLPTRIESCILLYSRFAHKCKKWCVRSTNAQCDAHKLFKRTIREQTFIFLYVPQLVVRRTFYARDWGLNTSYRSNIISRVVSPRTKKKIYISASVSFPVRVYRIPECTQIQSQKVTFYNNVIKNRKSN